MSFDIFEALENKVEQAIQVMSSLQSETESLRAKNQVLGNDYQTLKNENEQLQQKVNMLTEQFSTVGDENKRLKSELQAWKERLQQLLGKINEITDG